MLLLFSVNFMMKDPRFKDEVPVEYLSYQEHYEQAIRKSIIFFEKISEWEEKSNTNLTVNFL